MQLSKTIPLLISALLASPLALAAERTSSDATRIKAPATAISPQQKAITPLKAQPLQLPAQGGSSGPVTNTGRYVIDNVDYHIENASEYGQFSENQQSLPPQFDGGSLSVNASVIVVNGTIHAQGYDFGYSNEAPDHLWILFRSWNNFPALPSTCSANARMVPQHSQTAVQYKAYFYIMDTASKPECWSYFQSLTQFKLKLIHIKPGHYQQTPTMPVVDAAERTLPLGPLLPRQPNQGG